MIAALTISRASPFLAGTILCMVSFVQPASQPASAQSAPSDAAKDLLLNAPPPPDLTITATAQQSGWTYIYRQPSGGAAAKFTSQTCKDIVAPQRRRVQLQVTATETIHEWRVAALGIKATAIPGRIETVDLKTSELGAFAGTADKGVALSVRIIAPVEYDIWQRTCLAPQ